MGRIPVALAFLVVGMVLLSCAAPPTGSPPTVAPEPRAAAGIWEEEWERTLAAAKQEGEVVVYADPIASVRRVLTEPFEQKFGIRVVYNGMRGADGASRILAEREAGIYSADIFISGPGVFLSAFRPAGILEPIAPWFVLPEVQDPENWVLGHLYADAEQQYVFVTSLGPSYPFTINTEQVRPEELTSWNDLLNPKWKRKIGLAESRRTGPGNGWWTVMLEQMGEDYLRGLLAQEPFITPDRRILTERVARGALAIAVAAEEAEVAELRQRGLPVDLLKTFPREGVFVSSRGGSVGMLKNIPHRNAAKVYLNWFLGREGMELYWGAQQRASLRKDVPAANDADPSVDVLLQLGIPYVDVWSEKSVEPRARARESANRLIRD